VFPLSAVRAFGSFTTVAAPGLPTLSNSFNVTATTHPTSDVYTFTLTTNAVNSDNVIVIPTSNVSSNLTYSFTNPTLTLSFSGIVPSGRLVNFIVLQI
jgi:hypothetical protein